MLAKTKPMKKSLLLLAAIVAVNFSAPAQSAPGGLTPGMTASFTRLFGTNPAFTATVDMKVSTAGGQDLTLAMDFAVLDTRMRQEIDMTQIKGRSIPPAAVAQMKQMGMDRVINITRGDQKAIYIIYPGIKSYVKMSVSKDDAATLDKSPKIETTVLGKETVDGHACVKNKVMMTTGDGRSQEFTVWNASDLKDFPVQIQTAEKTGALLMRYTNIKFAKPDAAQFEPPAGYTAFDDLQQMMMSAMQKMMGAMKPPQK